MPPFPRPPRTLVVCLGNELVGDDGAGHAVFRRLAARQLPDHVRLEYLGVGGIALLELLQASAPLARLLVVDAVRLGARPGTVHRICWEALPPTRGAATAHDVGLREALELAARLLPPAALPREVLLIAIEGARFGEVAAELSPAVAGAVDSAVSAVLALATARPAR